MSDVTAAAAGGRLLFLVRNADFELELWSSDGTPEGSFFLLPLPGVDPFALDDPLSLTAAGDRVFFSLAGAGAGAELWTSDGTPEGTVRVEVFDTSGDIVAAASERPQDLIAAGRDVFFTRRSAAVTDQLWRSDGTSGGTVVVYEQESDDNTPLIDLWGFLAGKLYYELDDGEHGREPWASDGTPAGAHLLAAVGGLASGLYPEDLTPAGPLLFFRGSDFEDDWLWATDGTTEGTRRILPEELRRPDVLLGAADAAFMTSSYSGALWRTDGT